MGLGSFGGGEGAARYLAQLGARVLVTDRRSAAALSATLQRLAGLPIELVLGEHRVADFERAELVVANPAVRPDEPLLVAARAAGARVTSEIELFLEAVPASVVAVTGTQGKSSTCHLVHGLLASAGRRAHLGGNIGASLLPRLADIHADDVVVLELSSYQLEALQPDPPARAAAVAIVNILQDHLERHGSIERYVQAKLRILELLRPDGVAVLPHRDPRFAARAETRRALFFSADEAGGEDADLRVEDEHFVLGAERLGRVSDVALPGRFQRANALVALGLARAVGVAPAALAAALPCQHGLEHRLQDLGTVRGKRVIDNGVSTTPDSTISALESLPPGVLLLAGGRQKRLPLDELCIVARRRETRAVTFGEAGTILAQALAAAGVEARAAATLEEAIALAFAPGSLADTVLFSPACSSFDAFSNFEERARAFRSAVASLR